MQLERKTVTSVIQHGSCPISNIAVGNTATTSVQYFNGDVNASFLVTRAFLLISLFLFNK
jgi:hypothetical protein